jgi:hypothetical protein
MAMDAKYGKVTTEFGTIGEDEPVIVFRARDKHLPAVLEYYLGLCVEERSPVHHTDLIAATWSTIEEWQEAHPDQVRIPNSDSYKARLQA